MNIQDWFPLEWTGRISLQSKGCSRVFSNTTVQKHQFFGAQPSLWSNSQIHAWLLEKNHSLDIYQQSDVLFNMLARFIIAFLPRSSHLLISWPQLPSTVIWEPKKIKSVTAFSFSPTICHELMGLDAMTLIFLMLSFKPAFSFSSFTLIKRLFSSSSLSAIRVVSSAYIYGRKTVRNLNSILKRRDTLPKKVHVVRTSFSSGHIRIQEVYHKEGWSLKNWHFQTMMLEKTLESPLDSKEIKLVNPKINQHWIFTGRTDAEAEAPILWLPEELTHWRRPWCWERLKAKGEGGRRGWDG